MTSGVLLGVCAGLVVGGIELGYILTTAFGYFDGPLELARFAACDLGLLAAAGALAGLVEGVTAAAIGSTATTLGARRAGWVAMTAALYTLVAVGPVVWLCAQIFAGPQALRIAGHTLYAIAIGACSLALLYLGLRVYLALGAQISSGARSRTLAWSLIGLFLATAIGAHVVDQRVLPRLYPFFHVGLQALVFAAAQLAIGTLWLHLQRGGTRRWKGWCEPRTALVAAVGALAAGAFALSGLAEARGLRSLTLERTGALGRVLKLAQRLHPTHAGEGGAQAAVLPSTPAVRLPDGPHLGGVDVFLITIDAWRADRLNDRVTPNLARLAERGVVFDRAYAQVPHTSFSVATLLTGKHVYALSALGLDAARHQTLAEVLRRERYKTAAFYPPSVFFIDHDRLKALEDTSYGFEYVKYEYLAAPERTDQVIHFLEEEKPARAFVWVHYLEPHEPYLEHPGFTTGSSTGLSTIDRYEGEVRFVDAEVARLMAYLQQHRPHALVVLAADHGEEFGEHGGHYHGTTLYEEQVRVPLVFVTPTDGDDLLPHRHVGGPVGLVDVAPTLLSLIGIEPSLRMRGRDLGPWLSAEGAPADALGPELAEIDRKKMIVDGHDKLICDLENDACQLFDLAADPHEQHDLSSDAPRLARLRGKLDQWMAAETRFEHEQAPSPSDDRTRRLLERGRLGDKGATRELAQLASTPGDGPARREAARLLATLPPDRAVRAQLEEAARDPDRPLARWATLAVARLGDGPARARVGAFIGESCDDPAAAELCARAALALGDVGWLGRALERVGDDYDLGIALSRALGATHDGRALDPLLVQLGPVRTRLEVVDALGALGDRRALPTLERWVSAEPYIPVRAAMVRVIAALGPGDPAARESLTRLAAVEHEPLVTRALQTALAAPR